MLDICSGFAFLFIFLHLGLCLKGRIEAAEFSFDTLALSSLKLISDAHLENRTVRLSCDLTVPNSGAGRALYREPIRFRLPSGDPVSFSSNFTFSIGNLNPSSIGGGLAFVMTPNDTFLGTAGGYLGLLASEGSSPPTVAVEFDTLMDVQFHDINGNHVGLDLNSLVSDPVADLDGAGVELKKGNLINAWIEYDANALVLNVSVSYSNSRPEKPILSAALNLSLWVEEFMYVGFSGSTQGSTEIHTIEWWGFSSPDGGGSPAASPPRPNTPILLPPPPFASPPEVHRISSKSSRSSCQDSSCRQRKAAVAGVATAGAFCIAVSAGLLVWFFFFSKRRKPPNKSESLASEMIQTPKEYSYRELRSATRNFDQGRVIGHGAFGTVYKGIIPETGAIVAVKRCIRGGSQGRAEFLSELSIIGTLRHRNLVQLLGWCQEKGEILLVYDFMSNGSLDKALFDSPAPLPWPHRRRILAGISSALAYLHQECEARVIHRDVKASNVMLDASFNARLGDFGLAKQVEHDKSPDATVTAGTMGYLAPEYLLTGRASDKTDVFSFGAVALEVACGRRPIEKNAGGNGMGGAGMNLVEWVWGLHSRGRILEAADGRLQGQFEEGEMRRVLQVGLLCSHPDPASRPSMRSVLQMLSGEAELPALPMARPTLSYSTSHLLLSLQDSVSDCNAMIPVSNSSSSSSSNCFILDQV